MRPAWWLCRLCRKGRHTCMSAGFRLADQDLAVHADPSMGRNFPFVAAHSIVKLSRMTSAPKHPKHGQALLNADQAQRKPPSCALHCSHCLTGVCLRIRTPPVEPTPCGCFRANPERKECDYCGGQRQRYRGLHNSEIVVQGKVSVSSHLAMAIIKSS